MQAHSGPAGRPGRGRVSALLQWLQGKRAARLGSAMQKACMCTAVKVREGVCCLGMVYVTLCCRPPRPVCRHCSNDGQLVAGASPGSAAVGSEEALLLTLSVQPAVRRAWERSRQTVGVQGNVGFPRWGEWGRWGTQRQPTVAGKAAAATPLHASSLWARTRRIRTVWHDFLGLNGPGLVRRSLNDVRMHCEAVELRWHNVRRRGRARLENVWLQWCRRFSKGSRIVIVYRQQVPPLKH